MDTPGFEVPSCFGSLIDSTFSVGESMRQQWHSHEVVHHRVGTRGVAAMAVGALGFLVLAWTSGAAVPPGAATNPGARTLADGMISGIFVAGAIIAALAGSRRRGRHVVDDVFALALGMGCVASAHLVGLVHQGAPVAGSIQVALVLLAAIQVSATAFVLRPRTLPRPTAYLLGITVLVVLADFGLVVAGGRASVWHTLVSLALAAVGAAWLAAAWVCVQRGVDRAAAQRQEELDRALQATTRDHRERMHELRSTLAGLVNGSEMLEHGDISIEARLRLWESLRRELGRMQRLLSDQSQPVAPVDLDEALKLILELQRLKGRQVELRTTGDTVQARYDSLAEVVNILMDNAATHGGTDSSIVEVARRDEDTVDITVTDFGRGIPEQERARIFDWGGRGGDSPGEGIGLHLAQRLVAEDGGSLRLAEKKGTGSSFVISLPAPRHSIENNLAEDGHGSWRRSG